MRSSTRRADNWAKPGDRFVLADKLAVDDIPTGARDRVQEAQKHSGERSGRTGGASIRLSISTRATISRCRSFPAITSPKIRAPASSTLRLGTDAKTSTSGPRMLARACRARHQHRHSLHGRCRRPLHRAGARLHRQARAYRKGREGRRQRGSDQGAHRGRHADRARAAQASISAFMALEEAGHLPQHAAMVHRDGQAIRIGAVSWSGRRRGGRTLRGSRSGRDRGDALGAASRARTASPA